MVEALEALRSDPTAVPSQRFRVWFVLDVVRNESLAKFCESLVFYRRPDLAGQIKIEMQIVSCNQPKPQNFPGFDKMPNVAARKRPAGRAGATLFDGPLIQPIRIVLQIQRTEPSKRGTVSRESRRKDAIEHVHPARDHF